MTFSFLGNLCLSSFNDALSTGRFVTRLCIITPGRFFLEKLIIAQLIRKFLAFLRPEISLVCSQ
jgi:hypothetical protein